MGTECQAHSSEHREQVILLLCPQPVHNPAPPKPVKYCKVWKGRRKNFQPGFGADTPRKGKLEVMPGTCQQPITYRPQLPSRFHCNENINSRTSIYRS